MDIKLGRVFGGFCLAYAVVHKLFYYIIKMGLSRCLHPRFIEYNTDLERSLLVLFI